jgi:hypothetical protein
VAAAVATSAGTPSRERVEVVLQRGPGHDVDVQATMQRVSGARQKSATKSGTSVLHGRRKNPEAQD